MCLFWRRAFTLWFEIRLSIVERKKARTPLKELADKLPPLRRLMLQRLIRLLRLLSLYCETNKMTANNLAVVMGPNICRPEKMEMTVEALAEAQCVTNAVITLIMDYEFILPREPPNSDKHLAHVKRKSRVDNFMVPGINLPKAGSEADSITSVKEAEDAIDSKLSLSLSELKPDVAMAEPMSARGPARSRQRGPSSARNRGFSNALEWLVTSVQEDTLEDVISSDLPALPEESAANDSSLMSSSGSSGTNSGTTGVSSLSPSNSATLKSRRRMSKKAKTANDGSTQPESPREVSTASTSTNGSESASLQLNLSAGRRSKKLRSESSGNSTSADTASSTSEPPSPREGKSSSSGHKKKKSNKSSASASGDSPRRDPSADEENVGVPSPRRRIAPPSRESSVN